MARRLKPRYVKLATLTPVNTPEHGMALEAKDEDGRTIYVTASPKKLIALAVRLLTMTTYDWFRDKYNADEARGFQLPDKLSGPIKFS